MELPREWVEKAEFFRREAKRHLREGVYWAACFEAQQAAELYLKALQLALLGVHDFTHDLSRLLEPLREVGIEVSRAIYAAADAVTPHYTMAGYPGRKPVEYDRGLGGEVCRVYGGDSWVGAEGCGGGSRESWPR